MNALEFEAVAKDGRIEIPAEHATEVRGPVRVIVLYSGGVDPRSADDSGMPDELDELMDRPLDVPGFVPLTREEAHERR